MKTIYYRTIGYFFTITQTPFIFYCFTMSYNKNYSKQNKSKNFYNKPKRNTEQIIKISYDITKLYNSLDSITTQSPINQELFNQIISSDYGFDNFVVNSHSSINSKTWNNSLEESEIKQLNIEQPVNINPIKIYSYVNNIAQNTPQESDKIKELYDNLKNFFRYYCLMKVNYKADPVNYEYFNKLSDYLSSIEIPKFSENIKEYLLTPLDKRQVEDSVFYYIYRFTLPVKTPEYLLSLEKFKEAKLQKRYITKDKLNELYHNELFVYYEIYNNIILSTNKAIADEYYLNNDSANTKNTLSQLKIKTKLITKIIDAIIAGTITQSNTTEKIAFNTALSLLFMDVSNLVPFILDDFSYVNTEILSVLHCNQHKTEEYVETAELLNYLKLQIKNKPNSNIQVNICNMLINIIKLIIDYKNNCISLTVYDELYRIELINFIKNNFFDYLKHKADEKELTFLVNKFLPLHVSFINCAKGTIEKLNRFTKEEVINMIFNHIKDDIFPQTYYGFLYNVYYLTDNKDMLFNKFKEIDYKDCNNQAIRNLLLFTLFTKDINYYNLLENVISSIPDIEIILGNQLPQNILGNDFIKAIDEGVTPTNKQDNGFNIEQPTEYLKNYSSLTKLYKLEKGNIVINKVYNLLKNIYEKIENKIGRIGFKFDDLINLLENYYDPSIEKPIIKEPEFKPVVETSVIKPVIKLIPKKVNYVKYDAKNSYKNRVHYYKNTTNEKPKIQLSIDI